jgi:hypothetical protein
LIDSQNRSEVFRPHNDLNILRSTILSSLVSIAATKYDKKLFAIKGRHNVVPDMVSSLQKSCSTLIFYVSYMNAKFPKLGEAIVAHILRSMIIALATNYGTAFCFVTLSVLAIFLIVFTNIFTK